MIFYEDVYKELLVCKLLVYFMYVGWRPLLSTFSFSLDVQFARYLFKMLTLFQRKELSTVDKTFFVTVLILVC